MNFHTFNKNNISFNYPLTWTIKEEWDQYISAITIEDSNSGIYMIDIYHNSKKRTLSDYIKIHMESYVEQLPFWCRIRGKPEFVDEKTSCNYGEIVGKTGIIYVKTLLFQPTAYINKFFCLEYGNDLVFISCQYEESDKIISSQGFNLLISSFEVKENN